MTYDVIIEDANIYDGSGAHAYRGDVAIKDGKVEEIGQLKEAKSIKRIDGRGKYLCPGFIDVHSHSDLVIHKANHQAVLEPLLRQGITTFVGGNCGMGLAPFTPKHREKAVAYVESFVGVSKEDIIDWNTIGEFFDTVEKRGTVLNWGYLAPHGLIRIGAKGLVNEQADNQEIQVIKSIVAECLEAGTLGMSTGLMYFPGMASEEKELLALAKLLKDNDAVFTSHLRSYSNTLPQAIDEVLDLSRATGVKVQISHFFWLPHVNKLVDETTNWLARAGAAIYKNVKIPVPLDIAPKKQLARIGKEINKGLPIGIDAMPTGAGFTHALAFFPPWAMEGTKQDILNRLADKSIRQKIYETIKTGKSIWPHRDEGTWSMNFFQIMGFRSIYLLGVTSERNKKYEGKHFVQIGKERGQKPFDAVCDMLIEEDGNVLVYETPTFPGDEFTERSVYGSICDPNVSIVTDTILMGFGKPSHLFYDCYPKLLSKYVQKENLLSMGEAIRKSTSLPAQQLGIKNRGLVKKGYWADLVLFDPQTISSRSTPDKPDQYPDGIKYVFVNGHPVVTPEGYFPNPRKGQLIRRHETATFKSKPLATNKKSDELLAV